MARDLIIALDEGTSNVKAVAIDACGRVAAKASRPLSVATPQAGWVEQDGKTLIAASLTVMREVINQVGENRVAALAISNQRETAIGWQRANGQPLHPALTWQCSRSAAFCEQLRRDHREAAIRAITGLPVAPLFSGSKMRWLLDNIPDGAARAAAGDICLGTIDAWLLWHFTGGKQFRCDLSNAARTQLLNLHTGDWDDDMLALFGVPRAALPDIYPSSGLFGVTAGLDGIPDGLPILAMIGDSHAALYGHGLGAPGGVKATYGTGSSVMAPLTTPDTAITQLATTVAWHDGERRVYGLEGNIPHTGDGVAWMAQATGLTDGKGAVLSRALHELPGGIDSTLGVYFVPALTGTGAPWWNDRARGVICGLSRGVTPAHLIRAALEAIAYQIADVIEAMRRHPDFKLTTLMVDGGPTQNPWLMQFQADLLGCPVARSVTPELSALGAGLLARRALGQLSDERLTALLPEHDGWLPDEHRHTAYQGRWAEWREAVQRTLWQPDA
ncbi:MULTISPECIES: FGGY family carbohydrate kinase [unclassified Brenneria]|uniref:FGGY family carbohydrate kinase n=1 Tax=unclassified Brenneria TaxID=2634434 RepID=UPI0018F0FBA5|nr:FGGY-family carbohydrate kinase [Brenneria sp. L3-3C-1]MBJ7221319.1 FGGY-family carbohydrate kinase [Brenneria sp. L3-3C-1]MEE3642563.1 FGGY-family carbohydrate kinase [Brenneria sp. L3_3C_1]